MAIVGDCLQPHSPGQILIQQTILIYTMTTIFIIIAVWLCISILSKKCLKKHPLYGRFDLSLALPKTMILFSCLCLLLAAFASGIVYEIDSYRDLSKWGGMMRSAAEVVSGIVEEGGSLPTWERAPEVQQWIDNIDNEYLKAIFSLVVCIVAYIVYVWGMFNFSKKILWIGIIVEGACVVCALKAGITAMAHFIVGATSGIFNPYTGDMSDSIMIPFFTITSTIFVIMLILSHKKRISEIVAMSNAQMQDQNITKNPNQQPITTTKIENGNSQTKCCPFCGKEILAVARKCRYCGEWLPIEETKKQDAICEDIHVEVKKTPILYSLIIPLATLLILSIGLLVFHVNYVFTDYWVEEELIILPIIGVAIIGLVIYYSILYKVKSGDIFKKLKNPNVIGISCFALLVIIAVSYVFVTADSGNNPAKQKQETQMEDNSMTSDDEERDTVAVEAADPDETVEEEISNDLSSKEASVKKWVEKVYANVFSNRKGLRKGTFKCDYFSEELNMWIESIEEYDREHHQGEYGFFTEDIWTKSQDPSDNISASVKSVRFETDYMDNEYAEVVVCISDYGNDKTVYLRLYPDGDSWIIGDYDGMLNNMKSYLAQQS